MPAPYVIEERVRNCLCHGLCLSLLDASYGDISTSISVRLTNLLIFLALIFLSIAFSFGYAFIYVNVFFRVKNLVSFFVRLAAKTFVACFYSGDNALFSACFLFSDVFIG